MRLFLIVVAAFLFAPIALSQSAAKPVVKPRVVQQQPAVKHDLLPFDDSVTRLEPSYRGHDLFEVVKKIKSPPKKGEFEKTEEFESRVAKWQSSLVVGTVSYADQMAFELIEGLSPDGLKIDYDADSEEFKVKINFEDHIFSAYSIRWLETFYNSKNLGSRNAVTRMGVKFRVTSHAGTSIGIAIPQAIAAIEAKIKFPRDQAMSMKAPIKTFVVVRLTDPYTIMDQKTSGASLDRPDEWSTDYFGVTATLESVIFVNARSGEILFRNRAPFPICKYNICLSSK